MLYEVKCSDYFISNSGIYVIHSKVETILNRERLKNMYMKFAVSLLGRILSWLYLKISKLATLMTDLTKKDILFE